MKLLSIALATAAITVDAGTNKTLTPTPGIVRPTPGTNPPITPVPTEPTPPNVSVTIIYLFWFVLGMAATGQPASCAAFRPLRESSMTRHSEATRFMRRTPSR